MTALHGKFFIGSVILGEKRAKKFLVKAGSLKCLRKEKHALIIGRKPSISPTVLRYYNLRFIIWTIFPISLTRILELKNQVGILYLIL